MVQTLWVANQANGVQIIVGFKEIRDMLIKLVLNCGNNRDSFGRNAWFREYASVEWTEVEKQGVAT